MYVVFQCRTDGRSCDICIMSHAPAMWVSVAVDVSTTVTAGSWTPQHRVMHRQHCTIQQQQHGHRQDLISLQRPHTNELAMQCHFSTTTGRRRRVFLGQGALHVRAIHGDTDPHLCANFVEFGWPEIGKVVRYLPDKKNSARSSALASALTAPKISRGQLQTIYSQCPKFHPNPFTSGGVIAGRVKIVETHHKVFPILGEAIASSPCSK